MSTTTRKLPLSALPLPPPSHLLINALTPDPRTPAPFDPASDFRTTTPSVQRRARMLASESHFSYVSPLPLPFPYDIVPPEDEDTATDKAAYVERWLAEREAVIPHAGKNELTLHYPKEGVRDQPRVLVGLAETALRDCVPALDVGDAFASLGVPALVPKDENSIKVNGVHGSEGVQACEELVDVLSGHAVLMSRASADGKAFAPWSLRYSGHQFGVWAGQLGDGRAISVLVTPHPSDPNLTYELQLKGGGRTPFSRSADGLAVLRSSIREFLCSEAMHALRIPTTRALSLISLPELPVIRERIETACVLTRIAPSFLRIGSFEALNPPANMFFFGGGQQEANWEALRKLGDWVTHRVLQLNDKSEPEGSEAEWGKRLVIEVARRNALMVAGWQAYGFMHGVINTDNVSILGLTIDYGPYAFMDVFDPWHICNHTDAEARYTYRNQPTMILYALRSLLTALAPLIGAEAAKGKNKQKNKALAPGWAPTSADIAQFAVDGTEIAKEEMERVFEETCSAEYGRLMRKRLGLRRTEPTDESRLTRPLLMLLEEQQLDFHGAFRALADFRPALLHADADLERFVKRILALSPTAGAVDVERATKDWLGWLEVYAARIEDEVAGGKWGEGQEAERWETRRREMRSVNPRFVLRQWVLEEVIKKVEANAESGKLILGKVLQMCCRPFEPWGAEDEERSDEELEEEIREERRYCGLGDQKMLGFQCSCSS